MWAACKSVKLIMHVKDIVRHYTQKKANKPGRMKGKEDERINKTGQEKDTLTFQH